MHIDLNCDMGEGAGNDAAIMPFITSVNIACGYHAGNEDTMRQTISLAIENNVAIGAHPSFPDREHFGRREMSLSAGEVYQLVYEQLVILQNIANESKAVLHHVKPHGALYNQAARQQDLADAIVQAVKDFNSSLILVGLSGSCLITAAQHGGLKAASEVFADRTYQDDGSLTPRTQPKALIEDESESLRQVLQMVRFGTVTATSGKTIPIAAETICIHGDGAQAAVFAQRIHAMLKENNIELKRMTGDSSFE